MDKEDVTHTHTGILLSHRKNEIMPFAVTWMESCSRITILSEVNHTEKDKYMILLVCAILKKKIQVNLYTKWK